MVQNLSELEQYLALAREIRHVSLYLNASYQSIAPSAFSALFQLTLLGFSLLVWLIYWGSRLFYPNINMYNHRQW